MNCPLTNRSFLTLLKILIHKSKRGLLLETNHITFKTDIENLDLTNAKHIRILLVPEDNESYPLFKTSDGHNRLHNQELRTSIPVQWFVKPDDKTWDKDFIIDTIEDAINCLFYGKRSKYICKYESDDNK